MLLNNCYFQIQPKHRLLIIFIISFLFIGNVTYSQDSDSIILRKFYNTELVSHHAYNNLRVLCKQAPARITGSENSFKGLQLIEKLMGEYKPDTIYHQSVKVHLWVRGKAESASVKSNVLGQKSYACLAIGGSVATAKNGLTAKIVEIKGLKQIEQLGKDKIQGKIVFFNEAMDPTILNPGEAYGKEGYQRFRGAAIAASYGAVGVVVRSLTNIIDDNPHTGVMRYYDTVPKIPAICISTLAADDLSKKLETNSNLDFSFQTNCYTLPDTDSYNIIAEIKGSEKPKEIIVVGAHLDSWDVNEGASDDGVGCIHVLEALRLFKELGIQPKRTIRFINFIDEEMYQKGAEKYANEVKQKNEKTYAAFESDSGGDLLMGFGCLGDDKQFQNFLKLSEYFKTYGINLIHGHGDTDIEPLEKFGVPLLNTRPNQQRYFKYHHSVNDVFENLNERELQLTCAGVASFIYLIDKKDIF